jgi:hydrophobic/amphiphilic exporter-1 (mainly G- bacteria), HAE1 family
VQRLAEICIRRPVFAAMIIMALVVVGISSYFKLQVDRNPKVDLPTVSVRTTLPGASPEEIETQISQVLEEQVNTVEGITELRSFSQQNSSNLIVTFNLDRDIETATQDIRDRIAVAQRLLPLNVQPPIVSKFDSDNSASLSLALSSPNRPIRELTELADKVVKLQLERAAGVGEVRIVGGLDRAVSVWVDADRLAAYQIPITAVREALVRQNADVPGGNVTSEKTEQTLRTMGRVADPKSFNNIVVAVINGQPIKMSDLGYVEDGTKEQRSMARIDGVPTVTLEVRRQSGSNTVAVIEAAKEALTRVQPLLPPDVKIKVVEDQSGFIYAALHEINTHLIIGGILASLVVFLFMRSWQAMVIAGVAIPCSLVSAFGAMWLLGFTMNSVTMLALVLMVGIVIDDALVVLENMFRFTEEKHMPPFEAARAATSDIGHAVMATTLSLVVIFVPVSFMSSIAGRFLYQFGITAAVAVMVSLLVSFTLTPMMGARLLRAHTGEVEVAKSRRGFYRYIDRTYAFFLRFALHHRFVVAAVAIAVIASTVPMYRLLRQDFFPANIDDGAFSVNLTFPQGMSIPAQNTVLMAVEKDLRDIPGITTVLATVGGFGGGGGMGDARAYIALKPHEERVLSITRIVESLLRGHPGEAFIGNFHQRDVMNAVRQKLRKYKDVRAQVTNVQTINLGGGPVDISFALKGPDLEKLFEYAEELRQRSDELHITDASVSLQLNKPELRVIIDRDRAADLGVDTQTIANALRFMVGGDEQVSRFHDPAVNQDYDVQLRLLAEYRNTADNIQRLYVPGRNGRLVRLDNLVHLEEARAPSRIERLDRQRQVSLRAAVAQGYGLADRIEALQQAARDFHMPPGYTTTIAGRGKELERTFTEFLWAFLLSVIFMYMILASLFESLTHPLTILLSLPLSIPFALFSLWVTGNSLNLYSALGILVLFGIVKKNAILQVDQTNNLRAMGMPKYEAAIQANRDRLRPILMTTFTLVGGMLPLAVGTGPGSEERRTVAVVVIGGQLLALFLTLLVTPVAYSLMDDLTSALRRAFGRPAPIHEEPVPQAQAVGAQHFFKGDPK